MLVEDQLSQDGHNMLCQVCQKVPVKMHKVQLHIWFLNIVTYYAKDIAANQLIYQIFMSYFTFVSYQISQPFVLELHKTFVHKNCEKLKLHMGPNVKNGL